MGGARGRSKQAVFAAAGELFADQGYANTSVRDIAQRAGVDPAIVIRHYGSKEALFVETMGLDEADALDFSAPLETLGERLVRHIVESQSKLRSIYVGLVRASDSGGVGSMLRRMHEEHFVEPLLAVLEGPDRELRARLIASMVGGLMYSLWTVEDDALVRWDPDAVVSVYARAMQTLITP